MNNLLFNDYFCHVKKKKREINITLLFFDFCPRLKQQQQHSY